MEKNYKILFFTLLLNIFCFMPLYAQVKWNAAYQSYINQYKDLAIEQMLKHHIPASITLAQGLLESGAGKSTLAQKGNNHFGIKCHDWTGASMTKNDDALNECFRVYDSPRESFEDHSIFLKRPRYSKLFALNRYDYKGWATGLKECGYATNPVYAQTLINIIETYNLYEYDKAKSYNSHSTSSPAIHENNLIVPHQLYSYNKNFYVRARRGDTFASIAKEMDTTAKKLAKYNERAKTDKLSEGDVIYLLKKQSKATKEYKGKVHIVKAGESMYHIAQMYGIRLKSLYKMNKMTFDDEIRIGDRLRLY